MLFSILPVYENSAFHTLYSSHLVEDQELLELDVSKGSTLII